MRIALLIGVFLSITIYCAGQKISETFNPVIKEAPGNIDIREHNDGNYLVFGDIGYYQGTTSGSLIKVDDKGKRVSDFQNVFTDHAIHRLYVLSSGKILIQGRFRYVNGILTGNMALLNQDGSLDGSFAANKNLKITNFAVQSTGKIVIIDGSAVGRLNTDGTEDPTFSNSLSVGNVQIAVAENDKIYIASGSAIYRLEEDGPIDNTFLYSAEIYTSVQLIVIHPDGKLLTAIIKTLSVPPYTQTCVIQRFNADGSNDNSFTPAISDSHVTSMVLRQNGNIVFTGLMNSFNSTTGNAFELYSDGTFNRAILTTDYNGMNSVYEDGRQNIFVTGGFTKVNAAASIKRIAKFKPDYSLDPSFKLPVSRGAAGSSFYVPIGVQSDGKVVFGGGFFFAGIGSDTLKLGRVLTDGSVDPAFKPDIRKVHDNQVNPTARAIAVQHDDKIVVGGSNLFEGLSPAFNRLLPDGGIDDSFQVGNGIARSNGWSPSAAFIKIHGSKIYVFGSFDLYDDEPCQSFVILDMDGKKIGPEQNVLPSASYIQDIEIQPDGKIVLMGSFPLSGTDNRDFIRLNSDGSLDDTFLLKTVSGNPQDFKIDENGNILITGNYLHLIDGQTLVRYKPTGEVDNTLMQGTGFTPGAQSDFTTGYFVEILKPGIIAVGGVFSGYNGTSSPGLVFMDYQGSIIPFENPYDSTAFPIVAEVSNDVLYLAGNLQKDKGQVVSTGAKVLFPITDALTNYKVQANSESSMLLSWDGLPVGAEKISIERSSPDALHYEVVASISPNEHSFEADQLTEVTPYHFRISASNEYYATDPLELTDTTLISPQIALAPTEVSPESFVANWEYLPGTDSCLLQVSRDDFSTFLNGYENLILTTGSHLVEGLEPGHMYQYRVKRFRNKKASPFSGTVAVSIVSTIDDNPVIARVYPNPVKDYRMLTLSGPAEGAVTVHSMRGELLVRSKMMNGSASQLDVTQLPPGLFILTISSGGGKQRFKIVRSE
jgi:uncharacterized delta-60 repeat protein